MPLLAMDDAARERRARIESELVAMLRDGRIDGMVRVLERKYGERGELVEDAVVESVVRLIATPPLRDVRHAGAYLMRMADRETRRLLRREGLYAEAVDDDQPGTLIDYDRVDARRSVALLKKKMDGWPESVRVVTGLVLDAIAEEYEDDYSSGDLARDASALLGRQVNADEVRVWKSRGMKKLREALASEHKENA